MKAANHYLQETYLPATMRSSCSRPNLETSALVDAKGLDIANVLYIQENWIVGSDNTVRYKGMTLQIPPSRTAIIMSSPCPGGPISDDSLAIFNGLREIGRYHSGGALQSEAQNDPREASLLRPGSGYAVTSHPQPCLAL